MVGERVKGPARPVEVGDQQPARVSPQERLEAGVDPAGEVLLDHPMRVGEVLPVRAPSVCPPSLQRRAPILVIGQIEDQARQPARLAQLVRRRPGHHLDAAVAGREDPIVLASRPSIVSAKALAASMMAGRLRRLVVISKVATSG